MHGHQKPVLAGHVVSGRRYRTEWRSAQNKLAPAEPDKISQVRMPAGKLLDFDAGPVEGLSQQQLRQVRPQITFERFQVEFFAISDRRSVVVVGSPVELHRRSQRILSGGFG